MRTTERTRRRARGASLDIDLARRAERKLNRYHMDLNGVLAFIVDARGLPDLRDAPSAIDFDVRGRTFTADVTPDPGGGYCATVRGHADCFTEADTLPELREGLAEVTELMLYGADEGAAR